MTADAALANWDALKVGQVLPPLRFEISSRHAMMHVGANRDYMRDHYDLDYVRSRGHPQLYVNTLFHQSLVDRLVIDWSGPSAFLARRRLRMLGPLYVGDTVHGSGEVTNLRTECGALLIDVKVLLVTTRGPSAEAEVTLRMARVSP